MTNKHLGYGLGLLSLGGLLVLLSADVKNLHSVNDMWTPWFLGNAMAHVGNTLIAFVGGKMIPTTQGQRKDDNV